MFRLFECCALSFFERFVLSFSLKIERFVSDSAEIWICGLYTRNGKITLGLKVDEKQREVLFTVSDTGTGIPLEKQKLVFERFEKLNEYVQGTGLGLSICKLTVEKWGGEIWVDPGYTDGARFVFTHPLDIEQPKK